MLKKLEKNFEEIILMTLLVLMSIVLGLQIVARYVFNNSLSWSEELVRYLFIWSTFLGIPYSIKKGISIRVDFLSYRMSYKNQKRLKILNCIFIIFLFAIISLFSFDVLNKSILSAQKSPAIGIPTWTLQFSVFISSLLSIYRAVENLFKIRRGK